MFQCGEIKTIMDDGNGPDGEKQNEGKEDRERARRVELG
jgi:hypothetical protein